MQARRVPVGAAIARAETIEIAGRAGRSRCACSRRSMPRGIYLPHPRRRMVVGINDHSILVLGATRQCRPACVSLGYRLAPEHPYPCRPDDCEAAALWLTREGTKRLGTTRLAIGGESAGAHLSVVDAAAAARQTPDDAVLGRGAQRRLLRCRHDAERAPLGRREARAQHRRDRRLQQVVPPPRHRLARSRRPRRSTRTFATCRRRSSRSARATRSLDDSLFMAPRWLPPQRRELATIPAPVTASSAAEQGARPGAHEDRCVLEQVRVRSAAPQAR